MKKLFLIRHAKSSWENNSQTDLERPLNERGINDAPFMANSLKEKKIIPDLILSSPATRAISTAKIFADILTYPIMEIKTEEMIYEAGMKELMNVVENIDDNFNTVMLFGHNPGLTSFTNLLGDRFIPDMPTCAIAGLNFELESWKEIERGKGKLFLFDYPKNQSR